MSNSIDNNLDTINSMDIIDRISDLSDERDDFLESDETALLADWDATPEAGELESLLALQEDCEGYSDWEYGVKLIRYDYFENYTEDFVIEIGELPARLPWYIENNIDWKAVAQDIKADYISVYFDGIEYYFK
jgi:hypothetical protein